MRRAALVHALGVAALGLVASASYAQRSSHAGLGLNWVRLGGAEQCIASVDLMNRIEERAERLLFVRTGEAVLTLDGYVQPASPPAGTAPRADGKPYGWTVTFEISDAHGNVLGRRQPDVLVGSDCSVVTDAAKLIFDLMLDPEGTLGTGIALDPKTQRLLDEILRGEPMELDPATLPKGKQYVLPKPKPKPAPPPAVSKEPASDEVATPGYEYEEPVTLDLAGIAMLGTLPEIAGGVALHVAIPTRIGWTVELGLLTVAEQSVKGSSQSQGGEASFGQQSGSLLLCPPRLFSLLLVCAGGEYGRQSVSATGFTPRDVSSRDLIDLIAQGSIRVNFFSWAFMRAGVALLVPLLRHDYVYDSREGDQRLFRIAPVGGRVELGLGLHI